MLGKVGYLVRNTYPGEEPEDYKFVEYLGRWGHYDEVKRIVYFEVENDD